MSNLTNQLFLSFVGGTPPAITFSEMLTQLGEVLTDAEAKVC